MRDEMYEPFGGFGKRIIDFKFDVDGPVAFGATMWLIYMGCSMHSENHVSQRVNIKTPKSKQVMRLIQLNSIIADFHSKCLTCWDSPATIQAIIAGREIENVDPSRRLSNKTVVEQKMTLGDVSEWLYRGKNSKTKVNINTARKKMTRKGKL